MAKRGIKKKDYDIFLEQIKNAEILARENELGIWKKETDK